MAFVRNMFRLNSHAPTRAIVVLFKGALSARGFRCQRCRWRERRQADRERNFYLRPINIAIGIGIENGLDRYDPDPDSDFDPPRR